MGNKNKWVVTLSGDRPLKEIKQELSKKGFSVDEVFEAIGSITGEIANHDVEKLKAIEGVADVSPEMPQIDIGPPDASIS